MCMVIYQISRVGKSPATWISTADFANLDIWACLLMYIYCQINLIGYLISKYPILFIWPVDIHHFPVDIQAMDNKDI